MTLRRRHDGLRVLVVDDQPDAATSVIDLVAVLGNEVRMAMAGIDALRHARDFHPHVVLLDIGMPGMDGFETCRRLRAQAANDPVTMVAVTGCGRAEDREHTMRAGFDKHLMQPIALSQLEAVLSDARAREPV